LLIELGFKIKEKVFFFVMSNFLFPGFLADIALAVVKYMKGIKGFLHGLRAFLDPLPAAVQMHVLDGTGTFT
jgi:hypothetical protein